MATGKTSRKSYGDICDLFTASGMLMVDGGPEFNNNGLKEEYNKPGTTLEIYPAYTLWVNCLLQGTNAIFLLLETDVCVRPRR